MGHNLRKKEDLKDDCRSISPLIEIELISDQELLNKPPNKKFRTKVVTQNGLFPIWYEQTITSAEFHVSNIEYSFIRFAVIELDIIKSDILIAQATFPVSCLRKGTQSLVFKSNLSFYFYLRYSFGSLKRCLK